MFARREAKTRIRQRDWLKLAGEKIRREQVGSVPTFLSVRANKFAWWKTGLKCQFTHFCGVNVDAYSQRLAVFLSFRIYSGIARGVGGGGGENVRQILD